MMVGTLGMSEKGPDVKPDIPEDLPTGMAWLTSMSPQY